MICFRKRVKEGVVNVQLEDIRALDEADELRLSRDEFYIRKGMIYMDGNSLGLLSRRAEASTLKILDSWKTFGIDGWQSGDHPWFYLSEQLSKEMSPLVGGKQAEVIVTGSTTINLHQLLQTFYRPTNERYKIVVDELNFPTDLYAVYSHLNARDLDVDTHLEVVRSRDGHMIAEENVIAYLTSDVSMLILPSVLYRSGQLLDMKRLTEEAHEKGILVAFDLSHSIGSVPHALSEWGVDFAFWCTYKHLNGGPGAVGGMYVNEQHFTTKPGLAGWFGSNKEAQFNLDPVMTMADDVGAYQIGTPHILNLAPLIGSLSMFTEIGIDQIREKSLRLTTCMIDLIHQELAPFDFTIATPSNEQRRGGHVYVEHPEAARICKALKANGVIPDFRKPSGIRLAPVALYNSFADVWHTVQILKTIMEERSYEQFKNERNVIA